MYVYQNTSGAPLTVVGNGDQAFHFDTGAVLVVPMALSNAGLTLVYSASGHFGEVAASPTANTVLARLKDIVTALSGFETLFAEGFPLVAGEAHVGEVGGRIIVAGTEITRTTGADQYAIGDVLRDSAGALIPLTVARVNGGTGYITRARMVTDLYTCTAQFRLWIYSIADPTTPGADNAPWQSMYANAASRLGYIDLPAMTTGAAGSNAASAMSWPAPAFAFKCAAGDNKLYVLPQVLTAAFPPASGQKFYLEFAVDNN